MRVQTITYDSYEEMNNQYNNFMAIIQKGLELGYSFNYEITKKDNQIKIIVKQKAKF